MEEQEKLKSTLNQALCRVEVSDKVFEKIRNRTYCKQLMQIQKKRLIRPRIVLLIVFLLISTTSIGAVGYYTRGFRSLMNNKSLVEIESYIVPINQVQEKNGILVNIEEGMIEANRAIFVVSFTKEEGEWSENTRVRFHTDNFEDNARSISNPVISEGGKKISYIAEVLANNLINRKNLELRIGPIIEERYWQESVDCLLEDNTYISKEIPELKIKEVQWLKKGKMNEGKYPEIREFKKEDTNGLIIFTANDLIKGQGYITDEYQAYADKLYLEDENMKTYEVTEHIIDNSIGINMFYLPNITEKEQGKSLKLVKVEFEQQKVREQSYWKIPIELKPLKEKILKSLIDKPVEIEIEGRKVVIQSVYYSKFGLCIQVRDNQIEEGYCPLNVQVKDKDGNKIHYDNKTRMRRHDEQGVYYVIRYINKNDNQVFDEVTNVKQITVNGVSLAEFK